MIKRWRWPPAWRCGVLRFSCGGERDWRAQSPQFPRRYGTENQLNPPTEWLAGIGLGATAWAVAAFFGVGMAPLLQLGLLTVHHLPLRQTVGTTMLVLVFPSASGERPWHATATYRCRIFLA